MWGCGREIQPTLTKLGVCELQIYFNRFLSVADVGGFSNECKVLLMIVYKPSQLLFQKDQKPNL